jgi:hypothetical protein
MSFAMSDGDSPFDNFKRINALWESLFDEVLAFVNLSSDNLSALDRVISQFLYGMLVINI